MDIFQRWARCTRRVYACVRVRVRVYLSVVFFALFVCGVESFIYCVPFRFLIYRSVRSSLYSRELYHHTLELGWYWSCLWTLWRTRDTGGATSPAYAHTPDTSHTRRTLVRLSIITQRIIRMIDVQLSIDVWVSTTTDPTLSPLMTNRAVRNAAWPAARGANVHTIA